MYPKQEIVSRRAAFILRIWWEQKDSNPIWRGQIQHAASGDSRYFQSVNELLHFVELHVGPLVTKEVSTEREE